MIQVPDRSEEIVLNSAVVVGDEVELKWAGRPVPSRFSFFWLRDHCHSKESLNPQTLQRQVDTFSIPADIAPDRLLVTDNGRELRIEWRSGAGVSVLPARFLWQVAQDEGREHAPHRALWDRDSMGDQFPTMAYADIMSNDDALMRWLTLVEKFGFALASGTPATIDATRDIAKRVGYIRETIFGGMWDFTANLAFKDTAYTPVAIGPHTDGTYSIDSPGYQMFHCLKFDGVGGESTLVDGFKVADTIRRADPEAFDVLTTVKVPAHYLGDGVHLRAEHPIIGLDQHGDFEQIAYNNYDRAPFRLPPKRMTAFYRALGVFNRLINDPTFEISMRLAPGTALLFDNWRTLHGRHAYQGFRWLCGAYLNKEDFNSKLRVLRAAGSTAPGVATPGVATPGVAAL